MYGKYPRFPRGGGRLEAIIATSAGGLMVYDDIYVLRGDIENRIKELKLEIKSDRLSCHRSKS
jgi:hypothetical protein